MHNWSYDYPLPEDQAECKALKTWTKPTCYNRQHSLCKLPLTILTQLPTPLLTEYFGQPQLA